MNDSGPAAVSERAAALWRAYLAGLPPDHPHWTVRITEFSFGDSPAMADELAALVVSGRKQATATLAIQPQGIAITPDGQRLVYALMHDKRIGIADPMARQELAYILLPATPVSLHLSQDGTRAFASAEESDTVYVVNLKDRHIEKDLKTAPGSAPDPVIEMP